MTNPLNSDYPYTRPRNPETGMLLDPEACRWPIPKGFAYTGTNKDGTTCNSRLTCNDKISEVELTYLNPGTKELEGFFAYVTATNGGESVRDNYKNLPYPNGKPPDKKPILLRPIPDVKFRLVNTYYQITSIFPKMQKQFFPKGTAGTTMWRPLRVYISDDPNLCNAYYARTDHSEHFGVCKKPGYPDYPIDLDGTVPVHETGHAVLTYISMQIGNAWDDIEGGAFHEAFGDLTVFTKDGETCIGREAARYMKGDRECIRKVNNDSVLQEGFPEEPHTRSLPYSGYYYDIYDWLVKHGATPGNAREAIKRIIWLAPVYFKTTPIKSETVVSGTIEATDDLFKRGDLSDLLPEINILSLETEMLQNGIRRELVKSFVTEMEPLDFIKQFEIRTSPPQETEEMTFEVDSHTTQLPGQRKLVTHNQFYKIRGPRFTNEKVRLEGHGWSEIVGLNGQKKLTLVGPATKSIDETLNVPPGRAVQMITPEKIEAAYLAAGYPEEVVKKIMSDIKEFIRKNPTWGTQFTKAVPFERNTINYRWIIGPGTVYIDAKTGDLSVGKTVFDL